MKTIDDLLAYEQNREPDPIIQKPNEADDEWFTKFRDAGIDSWESRRDVVMHTSREGHIAYQEALREASIEAKEMIWATGRQAGKSHAAMCLSILAQKEEQHRQMREAQYDYNLAMHRITTQLEIEIQKSGNTKQ